LNLILDASEIALKYTDLYLAKNPPRTSTLSVMGWLLEIFRTPGECYRYICMSTEIFMDLNNLLVQRYGFESSMHMVLAIFLYTCGGNESNSRCQNRSGETISRKFDEVLNALMAMARDFIRSKNPNFPTTHMRIRDDRCAYPHFKGCIGALDNTHIRVSLTPDDQVKIYWKNRCSYSKCSSST
jgi:hypothetical protein